MKNLFVLFVFITLFSNVFAQDSKIAATVGVNTAFLNSSHSNPALIKNASAILSFNFGITDNFNYGNFAIRPGLFFTGKGGNFNENNISRNLRIYYFEAPVDFIYQDHKGKYGIFLGAGPYFSAGIGGTYYVKDPKKPYSEALNLYEKESLFRIGDVGAQGIIGYKLRSGYIVDINYDEGIANILSDKSNSNNTRSLMNRSIGVSFGYTF